MPSLAIPLWLLLAAAAQPDPLAPPPHGRAVEAPPLPTKPEVPTAELPAPVAKPMDPKALRASAATANKSAKTPPRLDTPSAMLEEPAEEIVGEAMTKTKAHKKIAYKPVVDDRGDVPERKNPWSADRYSAVVPPGLTLAALRSQLAKSPTLETATPGADHTSSPDQVLAEITKAREALRQETARLEALLKTTGNCGGSGSSGESPPSTTPLSPAELHEASSEQIDSVSKAMKGMKPEQAAALVSHLNRGLAAEILHRMKAADAGAILGILKPELAADLATEIATRRPTKKAASK